MAITKVSTEVKLFFLLCITGLMMYLILAFYTFHTAYLSKSQIKYHIINRNDMDSESDVDTVESRFEKDLKYILMYTTKESWMQYRVLREGQYHFFKQECPHSNCYLTTKDDLLYGDVKNFDAVVINVIDVINMKLPKQRTPTQKYIFHSIDPADHRLICREDVDDFFNWTWSYKLNSDIPSPFFLVKDIKTNTAVAPLPEVGWSERIKKTYLKENDILKFNNKSKAVAALVKNCNVKSGKIYARKLRNALKRHSLSLDIFGCGVVCPQNTQEGCDRVIASDYYFVLVQEPVAAEDYLTDRILRAYLNNAVPIIRSGVDLTKFLPTGSYVDARGSSVVQLAGVLHYIVANPAVYRSYFRWTKYYSFSKASTPSGVCDLCALLNDQRRLHEDDSYKRFRKWWYSGPLTEDSCNNTITKNDEWELNESMEKVHNSNNSQLLTFLTQSVPTRVPAPFQRH